jgi:hypothetical protein
VIPIEAAQTVGTEGDIILANLQTYLTVRRSAASARTCRSTSSSTGRHRLPLRVPARRPAWYSAPIARQNGANTLSPIVTLNSTRT